MVKHWFPREVADAPSLEAFMVRLDVKNLHPGNITQASIPPAITLMLPLCWRSSAPWAHRHCGQDGKGAHLSGVRLFPFSFTSRSSSEESTGEVVLASRSSCSCWARYWAGFCLASLAQCSSSRCSRGRLACKRAARVKRAACKQFQQR